MSSRGFAMVLMACGLGWASAAAGQDVARREVRLQKAPPMPDFPPLEKVHILPSTMPENSTDSEGKLDSLKIRGFDLTTLIAQVYEVDLSRVDFADQTAAKQRYDVAVVLPREESQEAMYLRVREALKKELNLTIEPESRAMEVYVVTSPLGAGPGMRKSDAMGGFTGSSEIAIEARTGDGSTRGAEPSREELDRLVAERKEHTGIVVGGISMVGGTVKDFCRELERGVDRLVVDESGLMGHYDLSVRRGDLDRDSFFRLLREQLGLVVTPGRREVTMLVARAH